MLGVFRKTARAVPLLPFMLWLGIFILIPLGLVVYYGVTVETPVPYTEATLEDGTFAYRLEDGTLVDREPQATSFSMANFARFADPMYLRLLGRSLSVALSTTAICLLLGYPVSLILTGKGFKHRNLLLMLIILPMWMNFLLRTYAWLSLLEKTGVINKLLEAVGLPKQYFMYENREGAVVLGMVYNFLPFMVLPLYTVMEKTDYRLLEAAADLGATPLKAFLRITLPYSLPGVLEGITMVFVPAVTTFIISTLMSGGKVPLIGDIIQQQFTKANDWHFGSAMSVLVMVIVLAFMYALNRADPEGKEEKGVRIW